MPGGSCASLEELPGGARSVLRHAERAVLGTVSPSGGPHLVPVCWAEVDGRFVVPIDAKPKATTSLQRVRNVNRDPDASLLFDHYERDWTRLGWVMVRGKAAVEPLGDAGNALVSRYEQYATDPPAGDAIFLSPLRILWWTWA